jgi:ferredoxin--NADP+ reductase
MIADPLLALRQQYNATISHLTRVHEDLMILRVRPDGGVPAHQPGQYTTLGLVYGEPRVPEYPTDNTSEANFAKLCRRSYSLSCAILDSKGELLASPAVEELEFYITLVRESSGSNPPSLTPRLFHLTEGDRLHVGNKITGTYTLEGVQPSDAVVFLATGTGEAPHNYMIWKLLRDGHTGPIVSVCCTRYARDLAYRSIHNQLMLRWSNYHYLPLTTREPGQPRRYIQELIGSELLDDIAGQKLQPGNSHFFLCGNPGMIGPPQKDPATGQWVFPNPPGVVELLQARGYEMDRPANKFRGNIHFEKYW